MSLGRRRISNFGRNISFVPAKMYWPRNEREVLDCMRRHRGERIRCIGAGHSWSPILATEGVLLDLRCLKHVEIDPNGDRVRVGGGCSLRRLLRVLRRSDFTLPTLGAITKQTVAGATSTGTHGSGSQSFSHFVQELQVATFDPATGEPYLKTFRDGSELRAARCALGSLGVVVEMVLQIKRRYRIEERAEKTTSSREVLDGLEQWPLQQFALLPWSWAYIVYRRREPGGVVKRSGAFKGRMWSFFVNDIGLHLILKGLLLYAKWSKYAKLAGYVKLTGDGAIRSFFRGLPRWMKTGPSRIDDSTAVLTMHHDCFRHVEMELFVPESRLRNAIPLIQEMVKIAGGEQEDFAALAALSSDLRDEVWKLRGTYTLHYPVFFRRVLQDDTLVSMASVGSQPGEAWYSISFFTYRKVDEAFARFAKTMALCMIELHGARVHWGKYFPIPLETAARAYPRFDDFRAICRKYDPRQLFWY